MKGVKDTSGKASQRKGADGERELAAVLREYGYEIKRGGSMSFGELPDLVGLPGIHIEVKRCEQVRLVRHGNHKKCGCYGTIRAEI